MICSECGLHAPALKTVYWTCEGDEAEERPLCDGCYQVVAGEVLIVPGPVSCFGTCRACGSWASVRDLADRRGGGRHDAPTGICRGCAG